MTKKANQILDKYKSFEIPLCKPKGGEVYLFELQKEKMVIFHM